MSSSYTSSLGLVLPVQGELSGTWGDTVNNYLTTYVDTAVAGQLAISLTADVTLTKSTGTSLGSTSSQYAILNVTPSASTWTITAPAASKTYVLNNLSSTYTFAFKASGGTAITVAAAEKCVVAYNGTDFVRVSSTSVFGSPSTAMTLNASGNLGLGVTPSAWGANNPAIQMGGTNQSSFIGLNATAFGLNAYFDGTNWRYLQTGGAAALYSQAYAGGHAWRIALSGNLGDPITFTQAMTLDSGGRLLVGTTTASGSAIIQIGGLNTSSGNGDLLIGRTGASESATVGNGSSIQLQNLTNNTACIIQQYSNNLQFFNYTGAGWNERMRLDSSGNLVIGNTVANERLEIYKSNTYNADPALYFRMGTNDTAVNNNVAYAWRTGMTGSATGYGYVFQTLARSESSWVERARFDASGNLGIGTSSPAARLAIANTATGNLALTTFSSGNGLSATIASPAGSGSYLAGASAGDFVLRTETNSLCLGTQSKIIFGTPSTEYMRLDSSGNLLVGTTTAYAKTVSISSDGVLAGVLGINDFSGVGCVDSWNRATSGNNTFSVFGTEASFTTRGSITYNRTGGLVVYNTTSDYRAKDIIGPVQDSGATIDALKVYEGQMKGATQSRPMLIAHEAQAVTPYAVTGEKDAVKKDGTPDYQQMDVSSLVPLLVAEIQSLRIRISQLEAK